MVQHSTEHGLPLEDVRVLDFSQFLAGPVCALRLADMGAEVIKVERPGSGDLCRQMVVADKLMGDDSLLFHLINRNKASVTADLKQPADLARVEDLIKTADVMIHNFRPGVMERIGLGFEAVSKLNPKLIYAVVSGYGDDGEWSAKPGQDLLVQARSGLSWLTGSSGQGPVPVGVSITDIAAGMHLAQGVLAALFRRAMKGVGALVEVSLLSSAMDLQFEQFTTYLNGSPKQPERSVVSGANVHATAPYGIYETADSHMALAMASLTSLQDLLEIDGLAKYEEENLTYSHRDEIKAILKDHLKTNTTHHWLAVLEPHGIWCSEVLEWPELEKTGALDALEIIQKVDGRGGRNYRTTTCPIRFDGQVLKSEKAAPALGADTDRYLTGASSGHKVGVA